MDPKKIAADNRREKFYWYSKIINHFRKIYIRIN